MPPQPGQSLSHYRLIEKIGQGGMGVVYRAEDLSLKRTVAIKFLTGGLFGEARHRARFLREARVAASLNHPNLCTIHAVDEVQSGDEASIPGDQRVEPGTPYIVMEYVEGRTLATVLDKSGLLPLPELLRIAVRIADGLAHAHANAVVHRDLKPANVMVTADGQIKILDFGLAKPLDSAEAGDEVMTAAETVSAEMTLEGAVLGTVAYMSPEQAAGRPLDTRSDIFSFGTVLYEMASGSRPFRGDSSTSTLAMILETDPPPLDNVQPESPPDLVRIVRRCLRKRPDDRYNDTRDLVVALKDLREDTTSGATAAAVPKGRRLSRTTIWATVAAVVVIAAGFAIWQFRDAGGGRESTAPEFRQVTFSGTAYSPAMSPDGLSVAYVEHPVGESTRLVVQDLDGGKPLEILEADEIFGLRWSMDGTSLLTTAVNGESWSTLALPRLGGTPRHRLVNGPPLIDWSPDGKSYAASAPTTRSIFVGQFGAEKPHSRIEVEGDYTWEYDLAWSPRGDLILFLTASEDETYTIWTVRADGTRQVKTLEVKYSINSPRWSSEGDAIYYLACRGPTDDLMRLKIDPATGEGRGEPVPLLTGLRSHAFGMSDRGDQLVLSVPNNRSQLWLLDLRIDGTATVVARKQLTRGTLRPGYPALSPDGTLVAYESANNLFVLPLDGGEARQLTYQEGVSGNLAWSPDGQRIAFSSNEGGTPRIWQVDLAGGTRRPFENTVTSGDLVWAPDRRILYQRPGNRNYYFLDPETEEETPLVEDESVGWVFSPVYSPDSSRVAVAWNRSREAPDGDRFDQGLWLIDLEDLSQQLIAEAMPHLPLAWSRDGEWIYAKHWQENQLVRISVKNGNVEPFLDPLPFDQVGSVSLVPEPGRLVLTVHETQSDIWLVEKFDPEAQ